LQRLQLVQRVKKLARQVCLVAHNLLDTLMSRQTLATFFPANETHAMAHRGVADFGGLGGGHAPEPPEDTGDSLDQELLEVSDRSQNLH